MAFTDQIDPIRAAALKALQTAENLKKLEEVRIQYFGTNGQFTALVKQMSTLSKEERPVVGKEINIVKSELNKNLNLRREELEAEEASPKLANDFTSPGRRRPLGKKHPFSKVTEDIVNSFRKIGFAVADGPEIESEYYCFDALNTPADHPARDTQDTFYIKTKERPLLRTHTSSVQIRVMEKTPPPIRIIVPGRVYRRDTADATHNPTFHQIEGLYVDKNVTVSDLKGTVEFVFKELLGKEVNFVFVHIIFPILNQVWKSILVAPLFAKWGKNGLKLLAAEWFTQKFSKM